MFNSRRGHLLLLGAVAILSEYLGLRWLMPRAGVWGGGVMVLTILIVFAFNLQAGIVRDRADIVQ